MLRSTLVAATTSLALLAVTGCGEAEPQNTRHPIDKKQEVTTRPMNLEATTMERLGFRPREQVEEDRGIDPAKLRKNLTFDRPESWTELPPSQFRHLNLKATRSGSEDVECYLTILPGGGTGARANLDRWRKQFDLPALTDAEFAALPQARLLGLPAHRLDLTGTMSAMGGVTKPDYAMTALFAEFPAFDVTLKFVGPKDGIVAENSNFEAFLVSLRLDMQAQGGASSGAGNTSSSSSATAPTSAPSGVFDPSKASWTVPSGWKLGSGSSMRLVTLDVPGGAQCWITALPGESGGLASNLNRWRKEMGQAPLSDAEIAALPKVPVLGVQSPWLDLTGEYQGMGGPKGLKEARLLALGCARPDVFLSVKMVGPPNVLDAEREHFLAFCQSITGGS